MPLSADWNPRLTDRPYFDVGLAPAGELKYVSWVDVMGSASTMRRSHKIAANFVMKLHGAALGACAKIVANVDQRAQRLPLYPLVDGLYALSDRSDDIQAFLKELVTRLSLTFVLEQNQEHRFMVRGGIARGYVVQGAGCHGDNEYLRQNLDYLKGVLFGAALAEAFEKESEAPPFGFMVSESARTFPDADGHSIGPVLWRWWKYRPTDLDHNLAATLGDEVEGYFEWCLLHSLELGYSRERIAHHRQLCTQLFSEI